MKFIRTIFAIYILMLTIYPCCDKLLSGPINKIENIQKATGNPDNGIDHCSPFCTCSCCSSPVIYQNIFFDFSVLFFPAGKFKVINSDFDSSLHDTIWQPPKLV